ncbi:MAG: Flp pilus assembly complex ATPase component TadA [Candidatus Kerfeldbacteria bacterium]|nr:Flp pilus assembly complex ATPase component TadA [Candidatus Kerfeldbacteria bacterium]
MPPTVATSSIGPETTLVDLLLKDGLLTEDQVDSLLQESQRTQQPVNELLETRNLVREEDLVREKSKLYNIPYIDLFGRVVRAEILNVVSKELAENYHMVAFNKSENELSVAMVDPSNFRALEAIEFIARKNHFRIKYYLTSQSSLKYIIRQYESLSAEVEEALKGAEQESELQKSMLKVEEKGLEEVVKTAPVSKMVSVILRHAVEGKASDVHIEPVGDETRVRFRIDGILHTSLVLPRNVHQAIVARVKVLSNLKIDETRIPQDGRFRMVIEGHDIDYRISTLPLVNNEKVVMRILDTSENLTNLDVLGFDGKTMQAMKENVKKSHGMFLSTGPTGSGKSTTLYALLDILNEESVNIVTLEDPVEYFMRGINQSQVNPEVGLTFAAGLRSILRQDPDIVMVGEIRDNETAELAVHAALTGHIVFSTLHTNDAFGAIPRLIDMKIEPFLIASSLNVVMAQRLVRRVCHHCIKEAKIPELLEKEVWQEITNVGEKNVPPGIKLTKPLRFFQGQGCVRCENSGYKGRIAIAEVLTVTPEVKRIIVSGGNIVDNLREEFKHQGMFSMRQDGIFKALRGFTTVEEVWDATRS